MPEQSAWKGTWVKGLRDIMLCEAITFDHISRELPEMLILIFLLLLIYVLIFPHPLCHSER